MENKKLSVEELFEQQDESELLFTLEPISDDEARVKMTPWSEESGCNCELSLMIKRGLIEAVTPTGQVHRCCGKKLLVVSIEFKEKASLSLEEVYDQVFKKQRSQEIVNDPYYTEDYSRKLTSETYFGHDEYFEDSGYYNDAHSEYGDQYYADSNNEHQESGFIDDGYDLMRCPSGTVQLGCGGRFHCVRPGSFCCHGRVCGPGNTCIGCGGRFHCARRGSFCCHGRVCGPGNTCLGCGGRFHCARRGSFCCHGRVCPPGHRCIGCGGRFHCVRSGCRCQGGRIVC